MGSREDNESNSSLPQKTNKNIWMKTMTVRRIWRRRRSRLTWARTWNRELTRRHQSRKSREKKSHRGAKFRRTVASNHMSLERVWNLHTRQQVSKTTKREEVGANTRRKKIQKRIGNDRKKKRSASMMRMAKIQLMTKR